MYLLLRDYILKNRKNILVTIIISATFVFFPTEIPIYNTTITLLPLIAWTFYNIIEEKKLWLSLIIIFLCPFYMDIVLSGPFVIFPLLIWGLHVYKFKIFKTKFFVALILLTFSFIIANVNLLSGYLFGKYISHRVEFNPLLPEYNVLDFLERLFFSIPINHLGIIRLIFIIALISVLIDRKENAKLILTLYLYIIFINLIYLLTPYIVYFIKNRLDFNFTIQFNRFYYMVPFLCTIILALSLKILLNKVNPSLLLGYSFIVFLLTIYYNDEVYLNYKKVIFSIFFPDKVEDINAYAPGYINFYSPNVFSKIDSIIGKPKNSYRVVNIGIHPAIAQWNGFYTLDSYQNNYFLSYKKKFRKIIEKELEKNKELKEYFDNWGSRCYIFSADLKKSCYLDCRKGSKDSININLNMRALKELGAKYIFSAVYIKNYKELNLEFIDYISHPEDLYGIYLYKIK